MADGNANFKRSARDSVLIVRGDLDAAARAGFRRELRALINEGHVPALVDLRLVTLLSSACVAELIAARRLAPLRGAELVIVSPSESCYRTLELLGIVHRFAIRARATPPQ